MDEYNSGFPQQNDTNGSQGQDGNPYTENSQQYNFIDGTYREYPVNNGYYPTPQLKPEGRKPKKKKRGFFRLVRFTAAALFFGLLAGAATSGYDYLTDLNKDKTVAEEEGGEDIGKEEANGTDDQITIKPTQSAGQEPVVVQTDTEVKGIISDVSDVVEKVMPSIVAINSTATISNYDFFTGRKFNEPVKGSGSGIIIGQNDKSLLILTNNHVVEGAEAVEIVFSDETSASAAIKGADSRSDIAVVEVDLKALPKETLNTIKVANLGDSDKLKAGEMVIAIGNALGYGQSVTVGYVSALDREVTIDGITMKLLQTDAAINPGNSGGALINTVGEVIGMNSVKYASQEVEGMGYSIPITDAIPIIENLMKREVVEEGKIGYLGVNLETAQEVDAAFSQQFGMPLGVYINEVIENSPAEKAGLKTGHIIVGVNKLTVETIEDLVSVLSYYKEGETITLQISVRENGVYTEKDLNVVLGKRPKR